MRETVVSFVEITAKRLAVSRNHKERAVSRKEILRHSGFLARGCAISVGDFKSPRLTAEMSYFTRLR